MLRIPITSSRNLTNVNRKIKSSGYLIEYMSKLKVEETARINGGLKGISHNAYKNLGKKSKRSTNLDVNKESIYFLFGN